jgi:hypothetical protein
VTGLILKLAVAPGFVVVTSLMARRDARVAGVVGGLPMLAGPILFVLALERGPAFATRAASGTLLGIVALAAFVVAYAAVARFFRWPVALGVSWFVFSCAIVALRPIRAGAWLALALASISLVAARRLLPKAPGPSATSLSQARWDLPFRALSTAVPILAVTAAAPRLGAHLSGLISAFPVITPVLVAFTHAQRGWLESVRMLRGFTVGFLAYALFCFILATTVAPCGVAASFGMASGAALLAQAAALTFAHRHNRRARAVAAEHQQDVQQPLD